MLASIVVVILGTLFTIWSLATLGRNFGLFPEVRGLVLRGPYRLVRHPVYLAHLCEMLAWSVGTGLIVCWALTGFAVATGAVMIRMEDAELENRFGEPFATYRKRVPAVLPRWDG